MIAVAIVIGSAAVLWVTTIALVRSAARARIDEELEFLSAAALPDSGEERGAIGERLDALDRLRPIEARLREVAWADGAHEEWLPALCAAQPEFAGALTRAETLAGQPEAEYVAALFDSAAPQAPRASAACQRALFAAWAEFAREEIAACRVVCELPWSESSTGGCFDVEIEGAHVARVLARAAIASGTHGDGVSARHDLERILALRARFDRVGDLVAHSDQCAVIEQLGFALEHLLALPDALHELRELDATLAGVQFDAATYRALRDWQTQNVEFVRRDLLPGSHARGMRGFVLWPRWDFWLAEDLELDRRGLEFAARPSFAALVDPMFAEYVERIETSEHASHAPRVLRRGACAHARLVLMRAALRARFEGVEVADAFIATERDPFTGRAIFTRKAADGSWSAWCTGDPRYPATATGADRAHDLAWPPRG